MKIQQLLALTGLGLATTLAACGSNQKASAPAGDPPAATAEAPAPTGRVIEVRMVTDGAGNYFEPAEITASPGDVVRFVLVSGVHNVSFPADQNDGEGALPETSALLQLPGQTFDLTIALARGTYRFQCDPHAALGMVGTLTVQ